MFNDPIYFKLLMRDQLKLNREVRSLKKQFLQGKGNPIILLREWFFTWRELKTINEEIDLHCQQAFFPCQNQPVDQTILFHDNTTRKTGISRIDDQRDN